MKALLKHRKLTPAEKWAMQAVGNPFNTPFARYLSEQLSIRLWEDIVGMSETSAIWEAVGRESIKRQRE